MLNKRTEQFIDKNCIHDDVVTVKFINGIETDRQSQTVPRLDKNDNYYLLDGSIVYVVQQCDHQYYSYDDRCYSDITFNYLSYDANGTLPIPETMWNKEEIDETIIDFQV
jgi:hypothetical protein